MIINTIKTIQNQTFDEERALYGSQKLRLENCSFDGPKDGESVLKESSDLVIKDCFFNLRYPLWHDNNLYVTNTELTDLSRAALWYTKNVRIDNSKLHGIKAFRECKNIKVENCDVVSPEFGWSCHNIQILNTNVDSKYFLMRSKLINLQNVDFVGKYSFQYINNAVLFNCKLDTKDAFWHAENVTIIDSVVKGEYLGWYSKKLTFINCKIIGTQPLCYCKNLKLINCTMEDCDLSFEKSHVNATILSNIKSVKNPISGKIKANSIGEIIDEYNSKCKIITK